MGGPVSVSLPVEAWLRPWEEEEAPTNICESRLGTLSRKYFGEIKTPIQT